MIWYYFFQGCYNYYFNCICNLYMYRDIIKHKEKDSFFI